MPQPHVQPDRAGPSQRTGSSASDIQKEGRAWLTDHGLKPGVQGAHQESVASWKPSQGQELDRGAKQNKRQAWSPVSSKPEIDKRQILCPYMECSLNPPATHAIPGCPISSQAKDTGTCGGPKEGRGPQAPGPNLITTILTCHRLGAPPCSWIPWNSRAETQGNQCPLSRGGGGGEGPGHTLSPLQAAAE